jgi:hypothetical protein
MFALMPFTTTMARPMNPLPAQLTVFLLLVMLPCGIAKNNFLNSNLKDIIMERYA